MILTITTFYKKDKLGVDFERITSIFGAVDLIEMQL